MKIYQSLLLASISLKNSYFHTEGGGIALSLSYGEFLSE